MRARWRSLTDQAAASRSCLALTSTKTSSRRRLATISISPTGLFQRRARMRKPLAMRKAAARLSAEIPVRNATLFFSSLFSSWRFGSAPASGMMRGGSSPIGSLRVTPLVTFLAQRQRALIDHAPRPPGDDNGLGDRFLQRQPIESVPQQRVDIGHRRVGLFLRRGDDDHDLAARISLSGIVTGEACELSAPHLLVQLGQLAANRGLARSKTGRQVGERRLDARSGLEQDEGCRNRFERGNACAPRSLLCRQETVEQETVGG